MKAVKTLFIITSVVLMIVSLSLWSYGQDNIKIDEGKLAKLIDSPRTKQILAAKIGGYPGINFDMSTMACDFFRSFVIVATVDFEHTSSGKHGTVSFAYRWLDGEFILIHTSYWWWGTVFSGGISSDTTWNAAGSPYYITDYIWINQGATLTIEPGTIVRFRKLSDSWGLELDVEGTLNCDGATFTTSCDIEDHDRSQIYDSDWYGIYIYDEGACTITDTLIEFASTCVYGEWGNGDLTISGCTMRKCYSGVGLNLAIGTCLIEDNIIADCDEAIWCYEQTSSTQITGNTLTGMDGYGWAGIYCSNSSPIISSNDISGFYRGIYCSSDSSADISLNSLGNNNYGIYCYNSLPVVYNNNIEGNFYIGLYSDGGLGTINAENNWWGDASGPYHSTLNPTGLGDEVSDYVDFDPWLTSMVTAAFSVIRVQ
ncbi:MAG: right-handed parallel beta-helix repeat-containing protein [Candidatus Aminicenantes bacterium]|jgi:hypothetical protein